MKKETKKLLTEAKKLLTKASNTKGQGEEYYDALDCALADIERAKENAGDYKGD